MTLEEKLEDIYIHVDSCIIVKRKRNNQPTWKIYAEKTVVGLTWKKSYEGHKMRDIINKLHEDLFGEQP